VTVYVTVSEGLISVHCRRQHVCGTAKYRSCSGSNACNATNYDISQLGRIGFSAFLRPTTRRFGYAELLHAAPQGVGVDPQNRRGATVTFDHAFRASQHIDDVQALDIIE
jgi:hypothetical protein